MTWENAIAILGVCAVIITAILKLRTGGKVPEASLKNCDECIEHTGLHAQVQRNTSDIAGLTANQTIMMTTLTRIETKVDMILEKEKKS